MGTRETYQRTLVQACAVVGDEVSLAQRLGVPTFLVVDWLLGKAVLPNDYFLLAVDLVLADTGRRILDNRKFLEEIRRRHPRD